MSQLDAKEILTIKDTNITTPRDVCDKPISLNLNWILKECAELLANPISNMLSVSYQEVKLPLVWEQANVMPLPKEKLVCDINKHLRPTSLTSAISKVAKDFVVEQYVALAIMEVINHQQHPYMVQSY